MKTKRMPRQGPNGDVAGVLFPVPRRETVTDRRTARIIMAADAAGIPPFVGLMVVDVCDAMLADAKKGRRKPHERDGTA